MGSIVASRLPGSRSHVRGKAHDAPDSARARVRRGIKFLNSHFAPGGGWRKRVDLDRLDTRNGNGILGQVFADAGGYRAGIRALRNTSLANSDHYGFNTYFNEADAIDRAWKSELRQR